VRYTVNGTRVIDSQSNVAVITLGDKESAQQFAARLNKKVKNVLEIFPAMPTAASLRMAEEIDRQLTVPDFQIPACESLTEITPQQAANFIASEDWWLQRKENGRNWRLLRQGNQVVAFNKKNESLAVPPALAATAQQIPLNTYFMPGELMPGGSFIAVDLLFTAQEPDLRKRPYCLRFYKLLQLLKDAGPDCAITPVRTWFTPAEKRVGHAELERTRAEGAVYKCIDAPFEPFRHLKEKFVKSLTAKIIPKTAKDEAEGHESAALGLLGPNGWVEVGHASLIGKLKLVPPQQRKNWQWLGSYVDCNYLYGYGSKHRASFNLASSPCATIKRTGTALSRRSSSIRDKESDMPQPKTCVVCGHEGFGVELSATGVGMLSVTLCEFCRYTVAGQVAVYPSAFTPEMKFFAQLAAPCSERSL
jgi:hypothetical protein